MRRNICKIIYQIHADDPSSDRPNKKSAPVFRSAYIRLFFLRRVYSTGLSLPLILAMTSSEMLFGAGA